MMTVAMVPILGGVALAIDYTEMQRQKQITLNALDAAGLATARQVVTGASDEALRAYAKDFFEANLGPVNPDDTDLVVELPSNIAGGGTLKLSASLSYRPYFFPAFKTAREKRKVDAEPIDFSAETEIRLKNTLEVALVLDNSGSMDYVGTGSGQKRMELLKAAAKQLVDTLADQANMIKQVDKPVQFALVPFAASVNVGSQNDGAVWMDIEGLSPAHHENFNWGSLDGVDRHAQQIGGIWYKKGTGWGAEENEPLTRFTLFKDMKKVDSREWVSTGFENVCVEHRRNGECRTWRRQETGYYDETVGTFASWQGCVETRPYPYNVNDAPPAGGSHNTGIGFGDPATMFVPMFAPDEPGDRWAPSDGSSAKNYGASNNWWNDETTSNSGTVRLRNMKKYYEVRPFGATMPQGAGPNYSCTTNPITRLTDVSVDEGKTAIKTAIDAMRANGGTNVPEGLAWGWRALSHGEPLTEGRPDNERGNDKVVIVLTDGENTYYTPGSLGFSDPADTKSIYSSYGYLKPGYNGTGIGRLFLGTSAGQFDYSNTNYTTALNQHMDAVCANAKAANVIVMTVALDLSSTNAAQKKQIEALERCASESRFRKDPANPAKPAKLFYNATGGDLDEKFKAIADELSNLRIVV
jgi:Flp pilus assembly protein TadG